MSGRLKAITTLLLLTLASLAPLSDGSASGMHNNSNGCSCHYGSSGPTISHNFPSTYTPGQAYSITVSASGGITTSTKGGFSLEVDKGSLSNAGTGVSLSGTSATHSNSNYRSWSFDWTAPSQGSGSASVSIAVNTVDGNGNQNGDAWSTTTHSITEGAGTNNPPTASSLSMMPSNPRTGDDLVASWSYSDSDGDAESGTEIRWYRDGSLVSAFNDASTLTSSQTSKGEAWHFTVTPGDGEEMGDLQTFNPARTILNTAPVVDEATISPANADETADLTANFTFTDADSDSTSTSSLKWFKDGNHISIHDGLTTLPSSATSTGDEWYYNIIPTDGEDEGSETTSTTIEIGNSNEIPTITSPQLTADGAGDTTSNLTASWNAQDDDGDAITSTEVEWYRDGSHVLAHDDENPLPSSATNRGESWTFKVRVSDGKSWSNWSSSDALAIMNAAPTVSEVSLTPQDVTSSQDLQLSYTYSDVDGDVESQTSIRWFVDGVHSSGLDQQMTVPSDQLNRGQEWQAEITPHDGTTSGVKAISESVTIQNSPPVVIDFNWANETFDTTQDLVWGLSLSDSEEDTITITAEWFDSAGTSLSTEESLSSELTTKAESYRVELIIDDGQGGQTHYNSSLVEIVNAAPVAVISESLTHDWQGVVLNLSAITSTDVDGSISQFYWVIDGEQYQGSDISVGPFSSQVQAMLTVIDEDGAMANQSLVLASKDAPRVSNLQIQMKGMNLELTWTGVEEEAINYSVLRSFEPISSETELSSLEVLGQTSENSFTTRNMFSGEQFFAVLPIVEGETSFSYAEQMSGSMVSEAPSLGEGSHPSEVGGGTVVFIIIIFIAAIVAIIAYVERMSESG